MKSEALLETANNKSSSSIEVNSETLTRNIDENITLNANELDDKDGGK